jgi:hypothetical protein
LSVVAKRETASVSRVVELLICQSCCGETFKAEKVPVLKSREFKDEKCLDNSYHRGKLFTLACSVWMCLKAGVAVVVVGEAVLK